MPHQMWKHDCGCERWYSASGQKNCPRCGQPGTFHSWGYSVVELMCRHERRTGYPILSVPIEHGWRHYDATKYGLPRLKHDCPQCGGLGVLDIDHGRDWRTCDNCNGDGGLPNFPPAVMRGYQQQARHLCELAVAVRTGRSGGGSSRR